MECIEYKKYLLDIFEKNGCRDLLDDESACKFYKLSNLLVEANKVTNLTAITDEKEIMLKHFIDSSTVCKHIPQGARVIDVGCGAGFPSLPLAILRSDISVTSLDSTGKKINFVNQAAKDLGLGNLNGICGRAEDYVKNCRETFDVCTGRAVSRMNVLSEICIPFVKVDGLFVAMKSSKGEEEYAEAKNGIVKLGCEFEAREQLTLFDCKEQLSREIYVFRKVKRTPVEYPRNYSQIMKKPL